MVVRDGSKVLYLRKVGSKELNHASTGSKNVVRGLKWDQDSWTF